MTCWCLCLVGYWGGRKELQALSEGSLIQRLKRKSEDAFEELVDRYGRRLYRVSFRILKNSEDAQDVLQETFLRAFKAIGNFREESSLYTWLYRVVCNQSLMRLRRQTQRVVVPIDPYLPTFKDGQQTESIPDWSQTPESSLNKQELSDFLGMCIEELPDDHRVAYILREIEKLSEKEVAEVLGISRQAAKNRVHRARLVIRKRVEERFFKQSA